MSKYLIDSTNPENYEVFSDKRLYLSIIEVPDAIMHPNSTKVKDNRRVRIPGDVHEDYKILTPFVVDMNDNWKTYYEKAKCNKEILESFAVDGAIPDDDAFTVSIVQLISDLVLVTDCKGVYWCYE